MQQMQTQISSLIMARPINYPLVEDSSPTPFNYNFPSHNVVPPQIGSSSTQVPTSQSPFQVESKVEIKVFEGRMDTEYLETWIQ